MPAFADLHTHSLLSDGVYIPAELIRRAEVKGYNIFAITDHIDASNVSHIIPRVVEAASWENRLGKMTIVPGGELTHVRPEHIAAVANEARKLGAKLVLCHGETLAEPVMPGTNRAAIEAGVDVLAHPGLISEADVKRAAARNVALEITAKVGHSLTNGHVAALAKKCGARLVFGTDGHVGDQLKSRDQALDILRGAGLSLEEAEAVLTESERVLRAIDVRFDARQDSM